MTEIHFPAEWMPQSATMIAWPHKNTDWKEGLPEITTCYQAIAHTIAARQQLIILCKSKKSMKELFDTAALKNIVFVEMDFNDTWVRDYGPITIFRQGKPVLHDFKFNGWGLKFPSNLDNQVNKKLYKAKVFRDDVPFINRKDFILEGGSIETDGNGTLMVTWQCMLSSNRNEHLSKIEIEEELCETFGVDRILWLKNGHLEGDDTDGHIDTLARFCDEKTIMYATCSNDDQHKNQLMKMEAELKQFTMPNGRNYRLVPVPLPNPVFGSEGRQLPATYLNFLFLNGAVLVPVYKNDKDEEALDCFKKVFTNHEIVPVQSLPLLKQNGSLHCATMQLPGGCV